MVNNLQPVTQVLDAYNAAVFAKDVHTSVVLYDPMTGALSIKGYATVADTGFL